MKHTTDRRSNASLANETKLDNFSIPGTSTPLYVFTRIRNIHAEQREVNTARRTSAKMPPQANLAQLRGSMAPKPSSQPSMSVLLPICLLATFLSCVVCAYRWQSERERKMDMEEKRKKKKKIHSRKVSESGYVLGTYKPFNESIRGYLWNTSKLQELSAISNNNTKFEIPTTPTYYSWPSQFFENIRRPSAADLPMMLQGCRGGISKTGGSYQSFDGMTDESGCCYSSEASSSLNLPLSSANTTKSFNEDGGTFPGECFVIGDDVYRLANSRNGDSFATVETLNGSLNEHWV